MLPYHGSSFRRFLMISEDAGENGEGPSTAPLAVDPLWVRTVGESVGVVGLTEAALRLAASEMTLLLRRVVDEASKQAVHSRRTRLTAQDIDGALAIHALQPLYGARSADGGVFRLAGSLGRDLWVAGEEKEVDLNTILNQPPPKMPREVSVKAHWLAIDGMQPAVPENPVPPQTVGDSEEEEQKDGVGGAGAGGAQEEEGGSGLLGNIRGMRRTEQVNVRTTSSHNLTLEQQVFFKEITEAVTGNDNDRRTEALHSLQMDTGLQVLLPRFSLAIVEGIRCNIVQHNLALLIYLMRMVQALTLNTNLTMQKCLHELIPAIVSCVVCRQLGARSEGDSHHWTLREFASRLLAGFCKTYDSTGIRSRVTKVLTRAWNDDAASLTTLYGSIYALNEMGLETVRSVVVPRTPSLFSVLSAAKESGDLSERAASEKILQFVTKVLINFVRQQRPAQLKEAADYRTMFGGFGDGVHRVLATEVPHPSVAAPRVVIDRPMAGGGTVPQQPSPRLTQRLPASAMRPVSVSRPVGGSVMGGVRQSPANQHSPQPRMAGQYGGGGQQPGYVRRIQPVMQGGQPRHMPSGTPQQRPPGY